jgi:NADH dehydrogenase
LSQKARVQLEKLGVEVRTGALVTGIDAEGLNIGAERIATRTVIWAAGVAASPLGASLGAPMDRSGRVLVQPDLSVPGLPHVFVVGDLAAISSEGMPVPGIAPAAKQMGRCAGNNVMCLIRGQGTNEFRYRDYGSLATIGRNAGVAVLGRIKLWGYPAWLLWLFAHIYFLIGFRNRVVVLIDWAWSYWTMQRQARIIFESRDGNRSDPAP